MFRRQILTLGEDKHALLKDKSVLVVGCGGLGNAIISNISCIGLRKIYLIDFDEIEHHNLPRQFYFEKKDVGKNKAEVLAKRADRCEESQIIPIIQAFSAKIDVEVDLVFDATDNFSARKEIDKFAKKCDIPWIYASVEDFRGQVGVFYKTGLDIFNISKNAKVGQITPMVSLIGALSAMSGIKTLVEGIKEILYYVEFEDELEIKKFKLN